MRKENTLLWPEGQKPGSCPEIPTVGVGFCLELCSGDESCSENMKCCSNGCGHECTLPVFEGHLTPLTHSDT
ncbi:WAP four-disulfide core domain protein 18-like [Cricetulus griseus]|uniref:WAP four-disulfide core domain protein 18-like n=1 Tax=Cricetulus griseus TaxID=10029 RepID=A0A9J7KAB9_CRIGR|nr:WAP four-disulfide core domain protein 18-like [Cricetulus griseus]